MKATYKIITKKSAVNLPTRSQVRHYVVFLHRIGLHNRDITIEKININE